MPNNPLTQQELYEYGILRTLTPSLEVVGRVSPYFPAGYFLVPPHDEAGEVLWRKFNAGYISEGIIDPDRLGTGATGAGNLYLSDDGTWKPATGGGVGNLDQVTDLGNTTTNPINVGGITTDYVQLDTTATPTLQPGMIAWNNVDGTADLRLKGNNVTLQVGQETVARVVNKTGANLLESEYKVVRVRIASEGGAQGQRLAVVLAQGDNDPDSVTTLGIVTENIDNNQEGFITVFGNVKGINTTGSLQGETWVDGDVLFLSPTVPGKLTKIKPSAPNHTVVMGYVVYAHNNNGIIFVKVDNGYELDELHNVLITSPVTGQLLRYNSGIWENWTPNFLTAVPTLAQVTTAGNTTTNAITVGGLIVDTNLIYTDTVNDRVGIGTTSPGSKLTITSSDDTQVGVVKITTNGATELQLGGNTTYSWIQSFNSKPLYINPLGNNTILNSPNGFVGIGTTSPQSKLHVEGANVAYNLIAPTGNATLRMGNSATGATRKEFYIILDNTNNRVDIQAVQQGVANRPITLNATGGNILIGTTTDSIYKLDVSGNIRATSLSRFAGIIVERTDNNENVIQITQSSVGNAAHIYSKGDGYLGWIGIEGSTSERRFAFESNPNIDSGRHFNLIMYDANGANQVTAFSATRTAFSIGVPLTVTGTVTATGGNSTNWNTAFGWGNHASAGYLTAATAATTYQPLDGDLTSIAGLSGTSGLLRKTATNTWSLDTNTYLTSFTETDPTVPSHVKSITTQNITEWNTAFNWGDHSTAGYLIGSVGWTGTITILSNPPGQQNIQVQNGQITNVS